MKEESIRKELSQLHKFITALFVLTREYDKKLSELKVKKNILSFADIESLTVKLLAKPDDENGYAKPFRLRKFPTGLTPLWLMNFRM